MVEWLIRTDPQSVRSITRAWQSAELQRLMTAEHLAQPLDIGHTGNFSWLNPFLKLLHLCHGRIVAYVVAINSIFQSKLLQPEQVLWANLSQTLFIQTASRQNQNQHSGGMKCYQLKPAAFHFFLQKSATMKEQLSWEFIWSPLLANWLLAKSEPGKAQ